MFRGLRCFWGAKRDGRRPDYRRVTDWLALALSPAAAVLAVFAWDIAVWALTYGRLEPYINVAVLWVLLVAYIPATFVTVVVGGPAWLVLHRLDIRKVPVFIFAGILIAPASFYSVIGHRRYYLNPQFGFAPVFAGACGGYVLHKIAYRKSAV